MLEAAVTSWAHLCLFLPKLNCEFVTLVMYCNHSKMKETMICLQCSLEHTNFKALENERCLDWGSKLCCSCHQAGISYTTNVDIPHQWRRSHTSTGTNIHGTLHSKTSLQPGTSDFLQAPLVDLGWHTTQAYLSWGKAHWLPHSPVWPPRDDISQDTWPCQCCCPRDQWA